MCRLGALVCWIVLTLACGDKGVQVEFWSGDGRDLSYGERREIEMIARSSVLEVRKLLPSLPEPLTLRVTAGSDVNPETGEIGQVSLPAMLQWNVDPRHGAGVMGVVRARLRGALFHDMHHLVRDAAVPRATILDIAVTEGLATVFERDFAGVQPPWGAASSEVAAWVEELRTAVDLSQRERWTERHPDGRRFIAQRAGTYIVDRAIARTGKTPMELAQVPTAGVLALAAISAAPPSTAAIAQ